MSATAARWVEPSGALAPVVELLLVHPETMVAYPCEVTVRYRGLGLRRLPVLLGHGGRPPTGDGASMREASSPLGSDELEVPWRSLQGFGADDLDRTPEGVLVHVLEVFTDEGVLTLLAPAPAVSRLLSLVGRWADQWRWARSSAGEVRGRKRLHAAVPSALLRRHRERRSIAVA